MERPWGGRQATRHSSGPGCALVRTSPVRDQKPEGQEETRVERRQTPPGNSIAPCSLLLGLPSVPLPTASAELLHFYRVTWIYKKFTQNALINRTAELSLWNQLVGSSQAL